MKAKLAVISSFVLAVMLFCPGCEPEPKTTAAEPPTQVVAEQTQPQESQAPQTPPSEQPSEEQARAEVEKLLKEELAKQAAQEGTGGEQTAPAEPEATKPAEQAVQEAAPAEPEVTKPAEQAAPQAAQPPQVELQVEPQVSQPSLNDVMVTVNGVEITRAKVDEIVNPRLEQMKKRMAGRKMGDDQLENLKKKLTQQATEALIIETLIGQQMKEHNIVITDQQIEDHIAKLTARENMTLDDLKALITSSGKTYEQWKQQMQFDKILATIQLAQMAGLGTLDVNEADALAFYQQNQARYEVPEQVRASHILIKPDTSDPNVDPNVADARALQKAQELLAQIKAGADFAQLAKENSACPSAAEGGDLGFAPRQSWVQPFSDAAFALQPGQVSDVVKTRFGYHIIKVTDRKEAGVTPFDQAKDDILKMLAGRREMELTSKYVKSLRDNAQIIYAAGAQPEQEDQNNPPVR